MQRDQEFSETSAAGHLDETGVPLLPFDPYPVAVEELDPGLLQSLLDGRAGDAQGISAPARRCRRNSQPAFGILKKPRPYSSEAAVASW